MGSFSSLIISAQTGISAYYYCNVKTFRARMIGTAEVLRRTGSAHTSLEEEEAEEKEEAEAAGGSGES